MPLYEYECEACGRRFEAIRKFSESTLDVCTLCGKGPVRRLMSSPAIQFKGTGWYITDYSSKGKAGARESASSATPHEPDVPVRAPADAPSPAVPHQSSQACKTPARR